MPGSRIYNGRDARKCVTQKVNVCDGCGRLLPKGSEVTMWSVWNDGFRERLRFCSDCQGVIYGCDNRRSIDLWHGDIDSFICREICECCDEYPICDKIDYQRTSKPGDVHFGDIPRG